MDLTTIPTRLHRHGWSIVFLAITVATTAAIALQEMTAWSSGFSTMILVFILVLYGLLTSAFELMILARRLNKFQREYTRDVLELQSKLAEAYTEVHELERQLAEMNNQHSYEPNRDLFRDLSIDLDPDERWRPDDDRNESS